MPEELKTKWNLELEPDIPTLCRKVDAILLESNDGRKHLPQAKLVIAAHKPMFIDKPLASTLEDAREIARLAREAGVPFFSSSSARFDGIATAMKFPDATGAIVWGPGPLEPHHYMDLSWYAIHPIELLYTLMGRGCEEVSRAATEGSDEIVGRWKDGRIGSVRANRPHGAQGAVVFRPQDKAVQSDSSMEEGYGPLLKEIVKFFQTGRPAGCAGRDAGNHGVHGRRPAQQGSRAASRCACADGLPTCALLPGFARPLSVNGAGLFEGFDGGLAVFGAGESRFRFQPVDGVLHVPMTSGTDGGERANRAPVSSCVAFGRVYNRPTTGSSARQFHREVHR